MPRGVRSHACGGRGSALSGSAALALGAFALAAWLVAGCAGPSAPCAELPLPAASREALETGSGTLGFEPRVPCAFGQMFHVEQVFFDEVVERPRRARVHFVVTREGTPAFTLSETGAVVPFTAIPQGSHRLTADAGGPHIAGFAGPSGSGGDIAYLRWRASDVTYELSAMLGPHFTERDAVAVARAMASRDGTRAE